MRSRDEIAQDLFGAPFGRLSAFAQAEVDEYRKQQEPQSFRSVKQENEAVFEATLEDRLEVLSRRVANVELENEELWIENSQLKEQLATLQAEWNQRSS